MLKSYAISRLTLRSGMGNRLGVKNIGHLSLFRFSEGNASPGEEIYNDRDIFCPRARARGGRWKSIELEIHPTKRRSETERKSGIIKIERER